MQIPLSEKVLDELSTRLRDCGLVTAFQGLGSHRLRKTLNKPGSLLRDGWRYQGRSEVGSACYRLGRSDGIHQEIRIFKEPRAVKLCTVDPGRGRQEILMDLNSGHILENEVFYVSAAGETRHQLIVEEGLDRVRRVG